VSVSGEAGERRVPQVAVVVPVYNGRATLPRCLEALREQTLPAATVYVVDNGSVDGTWEWLQEEQVRWERVRVLRETRRGPAAARNAGIRAALGAGVEFVAFVDADCVADRLWLERLIRALDQRKVGAVTGCVQGVGNETLVGRYTALVAWEASRADAVVARADYTAVGLAGCNACLRASVLKEVGLFDERLWISEDWDLGLRVVEAGWELRYAAAAVVRHQYLERTVRELVGRVAKYGPGRPAILRRHFRRRLFLWAAGRAVACRSPITGSVQVTSPDKITALLALAGFRWPWVWALLLPYGVYLGERIRMLSLRQGSPISSPWQLAAMTGLNVLESYVAAASLLVHSIPQGVFCV
jgi:GT2 family glycosyltransferase